MTDTALTTDQPAEPAKVVPLPEAAAGADAALASNAGQAEAETADIRSARLRVLDHFEDSEGDQTVQAIMAGTALARGLVDPVLSRLVKQSVLERTAPATYRLVPPRPVPPAPPPPAQQMRLDGTTAEMWLEWLWSWVETGDWRGPGDPPGAEGQGVPVDVWMTFLGQQDAKAKHQVENAALRDKLLEATGGNHVGADALSDVLPINVMVASGIPLDLIVSVVRSLYAEGARVLTTWSNLLDPVAQEHHRILASALADRWRAKLTSLDADARNSPTVRRMLAAVSMAAPRKPVGTPALYLAANNMTTGAHELMRETRNLAERAMKEKTLQLLGPAAGDQAKKDGAPPPARPVPFTGLIERFGGVKVPSTNNDPDERDSSAVEIIPPSQSVN